ncbi:MAG: peptidoglycan DD-metalloendopeptidase family protein [Elusimicrobiaceae bacterium]|nr:peptidoglycan DD-metalloendopeptidase family protein [Elusimicrobiaceae bacterium]
MEKVLISFLAICVCASAALAADGEAAHKQELERLKKEAAQKQEELKKYREQEKALSKEISALESRKAEAIRQKNKLESDISQVEQNILTTEEKRAALQRSAPMWEAVLEEELQSFYLTPSCAVCPGDVSLEEELFLDRALMHKAAFVLALHEETEAATQKLSDFEKRNQQLMAQSSQIQQKQKSITKDFLAKQQDLTLAKQKTQVIRKELDELNKSARALDDLLARFEKQRKAAADKKAQGNVAQTGPTSIAKIDVPRHSLPWPVKGQVISKFGKEYRKDLNTYIFRDGIKIAARNGEAVKCVAAGEVIYAGPFRSYGNVVIVEHGKGFFSIYGFLSKINVAVGDKLTTGGVLGAAGVDTQQSSGTGRYAVYFETRQGTTAVDPLDWLED